MSDENVSDTENVTAANDDGEHDSVADIQAFRALVANDEELRAELEAQEDKAAFLALAVERAEEYNFYFTAEELAAFLDSEDSPTYAFSGEEDFVPLL